MAKAKAAAEPEEIEPDTTKLEPVDLWRLEQFEALGFSPLSAFMLVRFGADYREARRLLAKPGCTIDFVYDQLT